MESFDIIVIGAGPGGYVAAIRAAQLGFNTAVIERSELGGICLNWGCVPTKALLKSAQALYYARHCEEYGFSISGEITPRLDMIVARSRGVSAQMSKGVEYLLKKNKVTVIKGHAKLAGRDKVLVTDIDNGTESEYLAKHIILATGARANSLPNVPIDGKKIISYKHALVPERLPASMAVIGSGAIGSELAFFYNAMGVDVTIIEYLDRLVPVEDDEVSAQLSRSFRKAGIKVMTSAEVTKVDTLGEGCKLTINTKKGEVEVEAEIVLSAVGVRPNSENIGLEEVGVELERGRVKVDQYCRTSVDGIYAIGDITSTPALAHVASAEGILCVETIAGIKREAIDYTSIPGCTYTTPEIASVGATERALKERGVEYISGKFPFTASGKAAAAGDKDGFVKLLFDAHSDKLLGAHLIGANVTEMISGLVVAKNNGVTAKEIIHSIHPHPTMSEAIMEAAAAAHNEVIHI